MKKYQLTEEEYKRILDFKRDLHMHPELSRKELQTTAKIRAFLESLPDFRIFPLETETGTGIAAQICGEEGKEKSLEIMLRADIDALPQTEEYESPWKSRTPGVMHACGHDFHTASLLGAALLLQRAKNDGLLRNTVDLVFQPAEEGTTGAGVMIRAGLFDVIHPDYCFGIHNWPSVQTGSIACHEGPLMSGKRNFEIRIHGAGGHGSMPHLNIDPIVCAAAVIQSLQTVVSRNTNPLDSVILTINRIEKRYESRGRSGHYAGVSAVIVGSGPGQGYRTDWIDCGKNRGSLRMPRGDSLDGPDTRSLEFSGDDSTGKTLRGSDRLPGRGCASFAGQ